MCRTPAREAGFAVYWFIDSIGLCGRNFRDPTAMMKKVGASGLVAGVLTDRENGLIFNAMWPNTRGCCSTDYPGVDF